MIPPIRIAALLLGVLALSACTPTTVEPDSPRSSSSSSSSTVPASKATTNSTTTTLRYLLHHSGSNYTFDETGTLLPESEDYTSIRNTETGEERYRVYTRAEDTGEDDQWGNPVVSYLSALYDAQGNLLYDWENIVYREGLGDYLIRQSYRSMDMDPTQMGAHFHTALWDPATGETVADGVNQLSQMDDGFYLALGVRGELLGVLDAQGNKYSGFPSPVACYYPITAHGFIAADNHNPYDTQSMWTDDARNPYDTQSMWTDDARKSWLMDRDFNFLLEGKSISLSYVGLRGSYILRGSENIQELFALSDLTTPLYTYDSEIVTLEYFDGERMILRTGERESWRYTLCDAQGNPLTESYDHIVWSNDSRWDEDTQATQFLARQGETVIVLGRDGQALYQATFPGAVGFSIMDDGYYAYYVEKPMGEHGRFSQFMGLLDAELEVIVPADQYYTISRAAIHANGYTQYHDLLLCHKSFNELSRIDLLDFSGNVLVQNLSQVGTVGENRVCAVRGFSMGLMDWQGNWVSRYSVFHDLSHDD